VRLGLLPVVAGRAEQLEWADCSLRVLALQLWDHMINLQVSWSNEVRRHFESCTERTIAFQPVSAEQFLSSLELRVRHD